MSLIGNTFHSFTVLSFAIYIRVNNPTFNRNIGKLNLHHMWDRVLLNTPGLKIKWLAQAIGHAQNTQPNSPTP